MQEDKIRINKYIALKTNNSRRKSEELIKNGLVNINGEVLEDLSYRVSSEDEVEVEGEIISDKKNKMRYYVFNKPKNVISSVKDEFDRMTVSDFFDYQFRLFPVGRLDYDSTGLVIMTNDGDVTNKLIHPSYEIPKTYLVKIDTHLTQNQLIEFSIGVDLEDGKTKKCEIKEYDYIQKIYKIKIFEGRNRQIRRMMEYFNKKVISLKRISIGKIRLGDLKEGKYRLFNKKELEYIKELKK